MDLKVKKEEVEDQDDKGKKKDQREGLVERLARENMELRSQLFKATLAAAVAPHLPGGPGPPPPKSPFQGLAVGPGASSSSSSSRPTPKAPVQAGTWPSSNENVARFKKQHISPEERIQRDIRNQKKKRKRDEKIPAILHEVSLLTR